MDSWTLFPDLMNIPPYLTATELECLMTLSFVLALSLATEDLATSF